MSDNATVVSLAPLGESVLELADELEHALTVARPSNSFAATLDDVESALVNLFELPTDGDSSKTIRYPGGFVRGETREVDNGQRRETRWTSENGGLLFGGFHDEPLPERWFRECDSNRLFSRLRDLDDLLFDVSRWVNARACTSIGGPPDPARLQALAPALRNIGDWLLTSGDLANASLTSTPSHSDDFSSVNWFGTRYSFSKGQESEVVRLLWEAWETGGHSLKQETIGQKIESSAERFELRKVFRRRNQNGVGSNQNPAWGRMIQQDEKGCYRLVEPKTS